MPTTIEIPVEPLTAAAFAPFGQLIGAHDGAPLFSAPGVKTWGVDFEIDGTLEIHYARFDYKDGMTFAMMERHFNVTQCFLPLGGRAGAPSMSRVVLELGVRVSLVKASEVSLRRNSVESRPSRVSASSVVGVK